MELQLCDSIRRTPAQAGTSWPSIWQTFLDFVRGATRIKPIVGGGWSAVADAVAEAVDVALFGLEPLGQLIKGVRPAP